jgi:hypothetical protein
MILSRVDGVSADYIESQLLHVCDVALACWAIGERIEDLRGLGCKVTLILICDAADEELGAIRLVEEMRAL